MEQLRLDGAKSLVFYVNSVRSGSCLIDIDQNDKIEKIKCSIDTLLSLVKSYPEFPYTASRLDKHDSMPIDSLMMEWMLAQYLNGRGWVEICEELEGLGGGDIPFGASSCSSSPYSPSIHPHTDSFYWGGAVDRIGNFRGVATRDPN